MTEPTYEIIEGEQKTDEWQKLREGLITGSVAKKVKGTGNAFLYETLAIMLTGKLPKEARGEDVDRGNELEPEARAEYERATGRKVRTVAFVRLGRLGLSPDGLVMEKKRVGRLLEIKSPNVNNHIRYIVEGRIPTEHADQVIHGFKVMEDVDELDFVSYCPEFPLRPLLIITARRSDYAVDIATAGVSYDRFLQRLDAAYLTLIK